MSNAQNPNFVGDASPAGPTSVFDAAAPSAVIIVDAPPAPGDMSQFASGAGATDNGHARSTLGAENSQLPPAPVVATTAEIDRLLQSSVSPANNPFINNSYSKGDQRLPDDHALSPNAPLTVPIEHVAEANELDEFTDPNANLLPAAPTTNAASKTVPAIDDKNVIVTNNNNNNTTAPAAEMVHVPTMVKPLAKPYDVSRNAFRHDECPELEEESLEDTYYILVQTLLIVCCLIAAKLCMRKYLPWKGEIELGEISLVYTGLFYLLGVVFGGVTTDLKEAEKMPMDVVCSLDQMEDCFILAATKVADKVNLMDAQMLMVRFARSWRDMMTKEDNGRVTYGDVLNSLADIVDLTRDWDKKGAVGCANIITVVDKVRRIVSRGTVVQRTDVLPAARALLHFFILMSSILLFIASYKTELACGVVMACVITVTIFMARMIKAMDDPFHVREPSCWKRWAFGSMAAVQTFPLVEYILRMERRLEKEYAAAVVNAASAEGIVMAVTDKKH